MLCDEHAAVVVGCVAGQHRIAACHEAKRPTKKGKKMMEANKDTKKKEKNKN